MVEVLSGPVGGGQPSDQPTDAELIAAVRRGDTRAYGLLYERHLAVAKRAASCLAATPAEREDLVAEGFTRVLQTLRSGRGPDLDFRPYLLVTLRHLAINAARRTPNTALFADVPDTYLPQHDDPTDARLRGSEAAAAFAELPQRWRVVLWHTEVEGESPAAIAPMLGMTPNGVAALAYRAREGLRQAYLRAHLPAVQRRECRKAADKLAAWVRGSISPPQQRKVSAHLERCPHCRALADDLAEVNGELRAILPPIVLGAPALSWLTTVKIGVAAAFAAVTAVTVVSSQPSVEAPSAGAPIAVPAIGQQPGRAVTGVTVPVRPATGRADAGPPADQPAQSEVAEAPIEDGASADKKPKKPKKPKKNDTRAAPPDSPGQSDEQEAPAEPPEQSDPPDDGQGHAHGAAEPPAPAAQPGNR
ncbi:MAG: sigma-70 family RNA polymerase sigma factor [Labedaea sp.]